MDVVILLLVILLLVAIGTFLYATYRIYRFLHRVEEEVTNEVHKTKRELSRSLKAIFEFQKTTEDGRDIKEAKKVEPDESVIKDSGNA